MVVILFKLNKTQCIVMKENCGKIGWYPGTMIMIHLPFIWNHYDLG